MSIPMGQPKPFASLSSGLLARKGQAKPAMRPQGFSGFGGVSGAIDDLGWNDMGHSETQPPSIPAAIPRPVEPPVESAAPLPPVLVQREELREEIEAIAAQPVMPAVTPLSPPQKLARDTVPATKRRDGDEPRARDKAAFTLRLNADRHLRLRLASALCNRSSQQLVTEALDQFLRALPEVEDMACRHSNDRDRNVNDGGLK